MSDYEHFIRVGYHPARDLLFITIPDTIQFPHLSAWVRLRDHRTIEVSPKSSPDAQQANFLTANTLPGCRSLRVPNVRHIGRHWKIMPVRYRVDGQSLLISIPEEDDRKAPGLRGKRRIQGLDGKGLPAPPPRVAQAIIEPDVQEMIDEAAGVVSTVDLTIAGLALVPIRYRLPEEKAIELMLQLEEYQL